MHCSGAKAKERRSVYLNVPLTSPYLPAMPSPSTYYRNDGSFPINMVLLTVGFTSRQIVCQFVAQPCVSVHQLDHEETSLTQDTKNESCLGHDISRSGVLATTCSAAPMLSVENTLRGGAQRTSYSTPSVLPIAASRRGQDGDRVLYSHASSYARSRRDCKRFGSNGPLGSEVVGVMRVTPPLIVSYPQHHV